MLLPLELLWVRNAGQRLQFGGVCVTGLMFSWATGPSGQTTLYYIISVSKATQQHTLIPLLSTEDDQTVPPKSNPQTAQSRDVISQFLSR